MNRQRALVDRIQRGMGAAARHIGAPFEAFRPRTGLDPLAVGNRLVTLSAAFDGPDGGFRRSPDYAEVMWQGVFDAAYTQQGDYLKGEAAIFFVAAQPPLLPATCVRANRTVSLSRPAAQARAGVNGYGGVLRATAALLLRNWPASIVVAGTRLGRAEVGLPGDGGEGAYTMLLPSLPAPAPSPLTGDLVGDDLGWTYVVGAAEQTGSGWRLTLRQVNT